MIRDPRGGLLQPSDRMTGKEFGSGLAAAALRLDFLQEQGVGTTGDQDSFLVRAQDRARSHRAGERRDVRSMEFEGFEFGAVLKLAKGPGPRSERAQAAPEDASGLAPIDAAVLFGNASGERDSLLGLGDWDE